MIWPVLAMAHRRLGHGDEARQWLENLASATPKDFCWDFAVTMIRAQDLDQEVCDQRSKPALDQGLSLRGKYPNRRLNT